MFKHFREPLYICSYTRTPIGNDIQTKVSNEPQNHETIPPSVAIPSDQIHPLGTICPILINIRIKQIVQVTERASGTKLLFYEALSLAIKPGSRGKPIS